MPHELNNSSLDELLEIWLHFEMKDPAASSGVSEARSQNSE